MKDIISIIKQRRIKARITQEKIAEILEISTRHYQRIESGKIKLSFEHILKLSNILKIDLYTKYIEIYDKNFLNYITLLDKMFFMLKNNNLELIKALNNEISNNPLQFFDSDFGLQIEQLFLFSKGLELFYSNKTQLALTSIENSLKTLNQNFNIDSIDSFIYSNFEYTILYYLAIFNKEINKDIYKKIILFLNENISKLDFVYYNVIKEKSLLI